MTALSALKVQISAQMPGPANRQRSRRNCQAAAAPPGAKPARAEAGDAEARRQGQAAKGGPASAPQEEFRTAKPIAATCARRSASVNLDDLHTRRQRPVPAAIQGRDLPRQDQEQVRRRAVTSCRPASRTPTSPRSIACGSATPPRASTTSRATSWSATRSTATPRDAVHEGDQARPAEEARSDVERIRACR